MIKIGTNPNQNFLQKHCPVIQNHKHLIKWEKAQNQNFLKSLKSCSKSQKSHKMEKNPKLKFPQILKKSPQMTPKSPKIEPWALQNVVKEWNLFLYRFWDHASLFFLPFLGPFWDPQTVQIGAKTRKIRCPKITWFFHWFYAGLGVVFQRFFNVFLQSKFRGSLESDFVKKLTKHWPWRRNQESAFYNFSKHLKKYDKFACFWGLRF